MSLGLFPEAKAKQVESCLKEQLDIDSWASFLELQVCDLEEILELEGFIEPLMQLIQFLKGLLR